jgi:AraC family transcriptional regulator of arabinose operon
MGYDEIKARRVSVVTLGRIEALPQLNLKLLWVHERSKTLNRLSGVSSPYTVFWFVVAGTRHITLTLGCEAKVGVFDFVTLYGFPKITRLPPSDALTRFVALWRQLEKYTSRNESDLNRPNPDNAVPSHLPDTAQYSLYTQIYAMLTQWFSLMLELMLPHLPARPAQIDHRVHQACTYMRTRLGEKLLLRDIAEHVRLSEPHLRTLFHKAIGVSPMEFLRKERLLRAKELLLSTDKGLKTIAETIGFDEQGQLSRASAWRKASVRWNIAVKDEHWNKETSKTHGKSYVYWQQRRG